MSSHSDEITRLKFENQDLKHKIQKYEDDKLERYNKITSLQTGSTRLLRGSTRGFEIVSGFFRDFFGI